MQKVFTIFSSFVALGGFTISSTIGVKYQNKRNLENINYSTNSFKNIIKILNKNNNHNSQNMESAEVNDILDSIVPNYYFKSVNKQEGNVLTWHATPNDDVKVVKKYHSEFVNNSPHQQERLTQSITETLTEAHEISVNLFEKISFGVKNEITGSLKMPLGEIRDTIEFRFGGEKGQENKWSHSTTKTISETIPSQKIIQSPNTILHVNYLIKKGTWNYDGVAQFEVFNLKEKSFKFPFFYFTKSGQFDYMVWKHYSIEEILMLLKQYGYGELLNSKNQEIFSVILVDDIDNPNKVYMNLPVNWTSEESGIFLEHFEEEII